MPYFRSVDLAAIALSAGLWGVLNSIFSPIFFQMFGLPFLCDRVYSIDPDRVVDTKGGSPSSCLRETMRPSVSLKTRSPP
jgi:hypothetical protein